MQRSDCKTNKPLEFTREMEGYTIKYLQRHHWRVRRFFEFEDLVQEAHWLFYAWMRDRYSYVDNPAWAMALWKRILATHITELANHQTKCAVEQTESELMVEGEEADYSPLDIQGTTEHFGEFMCDVALLPEDLRGVLEFILLSPSDYLASLEEAWRSSGRRKFLEDTHIFELLGVTKGMTRLEQHFAEASDGNRYEAVHH